MKIRLKTLVLAGLVICWSSTFAQTKSNPVVEEYGTIWNLPEAKTPAPQLQYKLVIDLKSSSLRNPKSLNVGLDNVARLLNLHVTGGVPMSNLDIVVAIHGGATHIVLEDELYLEKFGSKNPNLALLKELKNAGVQLYVCGQSLQGRGYGQDRVADPVEIALSMLTLASEKMMEGYGMLVFQ